MRFLLRVIRVLMITIIAMVAGTVLVSSMMRRESDLLIQSRSGVNTDLFLIDVSRGIRQNLSRHPLYDGAGMRSPDGRQIACKSSKTFGHKRGKDKGDNDTIFTAQ